MLPRMTIVHKTKEQISIKIVHFSQHKIQLARQGKAINKMRSFLYNNYRVE